MERTVALFLDADNVKPTAITHILEILRSNWTPIKMRAYGTQIDSKQKVLRDHGVLPVEVIPVRRRKNAVDLVLTIDALEELYCGKAESIAIASGDSDFTPLALKIREHCKPIMIFGHSFTPLALQQAATHFYCIGWFQREPACQPLCIDSGDDSAKREASTNKQYLRSRMDQLIREINAVTIGTLGTTINRLDPIFSPKRYGAASLRTLPTQLGEFTFKPLEAADGTVRDYEIQRESS